MPGLRSAVYALGKVNLQARMISEEGKTVFANWPNALSKVQRLCSSLSVGPYVSGEKF